MKKIFSLTILLATAMVTSGQEYTSLAWQTNLPSTPGNLDLSRNAEEHPISRIALHVNPVGYFQFGPVTSLEFGLTKHLVLNTHVRFSSLGNLTEELIYIDEEERLDELSGIAFGGGPLYFFGKRMSKPYAGILFEYDEADALYEKGEDWEWTKNDKTMLLMVNAGYRFRFKWGLFINAGIYAGIGSVKDHWDYTDPAVRQYDPSPRDKKFMAPYGMLELSIGFGL